MRRFGQGLLLATGASLLAVTPLAPALADDLRAGRFPLGITLG